MNNETTKTVKHFVRNNTKKHWTRYKTVIKKKYLMTLMKSRLGLLVTKLSQRFEISGGF